VVERTVIELLFGFVAGFIVGIGVLILITTFLW
jgi:hypothetical protein